MYNQNDNAADLERYIEYVAEFSRDLRTERAQLARLEAEAMRVRSMSENKDRMSGPGAIEMNEIRNQQLTINSRIRLAESQARFFQTAIDRVERWM
jgi:hypothetical protein